MTLHRDAFEPEGSICILPTLELFLMPDPAVCKPR